jgi:hypothetical protein
VQWHFIFMISFEGRALLSQCADALSSPFAKEYVLEVAGIGKLMLEEGADIANMAIDIVEKNPELLASEQSVAEVLYEGSKDLASPTGTIWDFIKMTDVIDLVC